MNRVVGFQWYDGKQYALVDCTPEEYAAREAERMDALCALEFRAAKAEAALAKLHAAVRQYAITQHYCRICNCFWEEAGAESHDDGCIAAAKEKL